MSSPAIRALRRTLIFDENKKYYTKEERKFLKKAIETPLLPKGDNEFLD